MLEYCQTSKMGLFVKILNVFQLLTVFPKTVNKVLNKLFINLFKANDENKLGAARLNLYNAQTANIEHIFSGSCLQIEQLLENCCVMFKTC